MFFVADVLLPTLKINLFIFTIRVLRYSIPFALFGSEVGSIEVVSDLDSFGWLTENGEKKPVLKVVIKGENIELPLRQAPFCHLAETKKCECFVLRKDAEKSLKWNVASFVKCGDEVRGSFMNSSNNFEITPKKNGESGQHTVQNYKSDGNLTGTNLQKPVNEQMEKQIEINQSSSKYLKPLPEYGQLLGNETGYITAKFVVSKSMFEYVSEADVDVYLQNYVNTVNQIMYQLNMLIVYRGWMESFGDEDKLNASIPIRFVLGSRHSLYDEKRIHDALILIGPVESPELASWPNHLCYKVTAKFVKYFPARTPFNKQTEYKLLAMVMGDGYGIPLIDHSICGDPPEGVVWIMTINEPYRLGKLQFAKCSINALRKMRVQLACLRRKIKSTRSACGNGQVEDGEECDCVADDCRGCCTEDCKLTKNSACSNGPCCDISKCQLHDKMKQCRGADDLCDIPELCDGKSSKCRSNYVVANGYKCNGTSDDNGYCYNGICGNRQDVCGWAFYQGSNAGDKCYDFNLIGNTESGGCGPTFQSKLNYLPNGTGGPSYMACDPKNKLCGKIYCIQPRMEQRKEMTYTGKSSYYFGRGGNVLYSEIKNRSCAYMGIYINFRALKDDPTFVPNGSPCGDISMCVNQTCSSLPQGCPENCPGEKIRHPYTGEIYPAFELEIEGDDRIDEDDGRKNPEPGSSLLYLIGLIGLLIILSALGAIFAIHLKKNENSVKSSETSRTVSSKET